MAGKIIHEQFKCIGCGACASVTPDFWEMHGELSHVIGSIAKKTDEGIVEELEIEDKDVAANEEAADVCPVNCIHVKKLEVNVEMIT
ncbi:MAG: ferredoxin [Candidatus Woesearchaeota archaeon]|nr:MAG: ferredoxin [Candidatus Woesearchaeota archaeon]